MSRVEIEGGRTAGLRSAKPGAENIVVRFEAVTPEHARGWIGALEHNGAHVRIRVGDQGTGMPLHVMERIFDPFFTTKEVGRGTGLGLSSVLGIVSAHGGAISVDSVLGKGTTFDLLLPIEAAAAADESPAEAADGAGQSARSLAGARVLVVDDDETAGQALVGILDKIGCEPAFCQGGGEALELLADEPAMFDLIITDLHMPQMTGLELAASLRARGFQRPLVLVTGRTQDAAPQERARLGIELVLAKPFTLKEVAGIVWSALRRDGERSGTGAPARGGEPAAGA
ncbi:MAG: response regulator [Rhodospirillaceae bacterium]|nr:response regulator [Rhodospirillaceae bacterium]